MTSQDCHPLVISVANQLYEFMRDMSLLIATGGVASLSNIFQKRSKFVESLKEEWRNIVRTKSVLLGTCEKPYLATDDYLAALYKISETIDTMRIVYREPGGRAAALSASTLLSRCRTCAALLQENYEPGSRRKYRSNRRRVGARRDF